MNHLFIILYTFLLLELVVFIYNHSFIGFFIFYKLHVCVHILSSLPPILVRVFHHHHNRLAIQIITAFNSNVFLKYNENDDGGGFVGMPMMNRGQTRI